MITLDIFMTAWARYEQRVDYLERVIKSTKKYLILDKSISPSFYITAETKLAKYQSKLKKLAKDNGWKLLLHTGEPNVGANINNALKVLKSNYMLYLQDDFAFTSPINIIDDIRFLKRHSNVGLLRYFWRSWRHSPITKLEDGYFLLSKKCKNHYYSDRPHLKVGNFHDVVGRYLTIDNSVSENNMNRRVRECKFDVALKTNPLGDNERPVFFEGIGNVSSMTEKWAKHAKNKKKKLKKR